MQKFMAQKKFQAQEFADLMQDNPETQALYGPMLETIGHVALTEASMYDVHPLGSERINPSQGPSGWTVQWPKMSTTVRFEHISHIDGSIKTGVYYRPAKKTYETIDSFVLIDGHRLDSNKYAQGQIVLVLIQTTVSKTHWVNGSNVKRIHADVYNKWEGKTEETFTRALPRVLEFATRKFPKGVHTYQTPKKDKKKPFHPNRLPELPQYALVLEKDFETVWRIAENHMPEPSAEPSEEPSEESSDSEE